MKVKLKRRALELAITRKNLSQNGLARRLGISSGYMSQLVTGKRGLSARMRRRLLVYLRGYAFDDLFLIDGDDVDARKR